ncbi:heat shock 70 kDa protein 12B-like [Saccostrea cucullata]|uniref:heat shock 70 kDa protein 12B-like n=1 Tax=Saccostrea cuccullata TaxID=36930 RepID=UPI002ED4A4F6
MTKEGSGRQAVLKKNSLSLTQDNLSSNSIKTQGYSVSAQSLRTTSVPLSTSTVPPESTSVPLSMSSVYTVKTSVLLRTSSVSQYRAQYNSGFSQYHSVLAQGGTIDTTVHEILDDYYRVRELHKAAGGNWGGTKVDEKWIEFLEELSGEEAMDEFRKTECYDVVDLYRDFETKKRTIKEDPDQKIHPNVKPVNIILLVGGYAECPLLQSAIENEFPSKTVIVPSFSGVAVLKGAVMFGHNPTLIHERIAKYTYGIAVCRLFEKGKHREDYMFERDGKIWCDNVFRSHVKSGEKIQVGKCQSSECYETFKGSGGVIVPVYASTVENPQYVTDDGCCLIGKIKFALNKDCTFGETINNLKVNFSFGGTEIEVKLECMKTGKTKSLYLDTQ